MQRLYLSDKVFVSILIGIFAGIVVHTPITIWLGTFFPDSTLLLKSWKEVLMGIALLVSAVILIQRKRWRILLHPVILIAGLYALMHILLLNFSFDNVTSVQAGVLIDLRYILYFVLVYVASSLYPQLRRIFVTVFLVGAAIICGFAVLQVFVLPPDILSAIGYDDTTISPYLTVDENPEYIRINSTLRGPNPLGAYAVIVLAVIAAFCIKRGKQLRQKQAGVVALLAVAATVAVWASYSRSAGVACIVALAIVFLITIGRRLKAGVWLGLIASAGILLGGLYIARDTSFVSNVILHENEGTGAATSSNQGHLDSLNDGTARLLAQPLGAGIGSTGSASLYSNDPIIIENQYLFIAHEVGWLGLALFVVLFGYILWLIWRRRDDWLALGVLASGIGLAIIGLLLPVWVDDTVSIIWWGLAGLIIGGPYVRAIN